MKKFLKIMSLMLIVPVLGIGSLLTGCKKEETSLSDVLNAYNNMVNTYVSGNNNSIFIYKEDAENETEDAVIKTENPNYLAKERLTFKEELGKIDYDTEKDISDALKTRYNQLYHIDHNVNVNISFAELLGYSNKYFEEYYKEFFETELEIDSGALSNLLDKVENLSSKLETFVSSYNYAKDLAQFLTPNTEVMSTKLTTFNSVYVDLINANFEFVLEFCDVHKNYVMYANLDSLDGNYAAQSAIAERYIYEAGLKYAYAYFIDNVKTYQNNGLCDTLTLETTKDEAFNLANDTKDLFEKLDNIDGEYGWKLKIASNESDESIARKTVLLKEYAPRLKQSIERFDVFLNLYKKNASDFAMYTYNQLRAHTDNTIYKDMDEFEDSLSAEEKAKLTVIKNFTEYDAATLLNATKEIYNAEVNNNN